MLTFKDFLQEENTIGLRDHLIQIINRLSHLDSSDIEDSKELLLDLQKMLDEKLTGGV